MYSSFDSEFIKKLDEHRRRGEFVSYSKHKQNIKKRTENFYFYKMKNTV